MVSIEVERMPGVVYADMPNRLKLRINPELADLLPPLSTAEAEGLRASIAQHGVLAPIDVTSEGVILDGHHRYRFGGDDIPYRVIEGVRDEIEQMCYVLKMHNCQRHLSPDQKRELHKALARVAGPLAITEPKLHNAKWHAKQICFAWSRTVEAVIETGLRIQRAKVELGHGKFTAMVEKQLPFGIRQAERLMAIAEDHRLSNASRASLLPTAVNTLYELTRVDDDVFDAAIESGAINPKMTRAAAAELVQS